METDEVRKCSWNQAARSFGTSYIFEQRGNRLRKQIRLLTFLGLVVPGLVGGIILSFGTDFSYLPWVMGAAGFLSLVQFIGSLWSLVAKWDDGLAYSTMASAQNKDLSIRFRELAQNPPSNILELKHQYELIQMEYRKRNEADEVQGITECEKRKGMRAALREFQRPCVGCKQVPISMEPSNCDICGNF